MSYYSEGIQKALGCSADDAVRVEHMVRWEKGTLNSLSKRSINAAAKKAWAELQRLRAHPQQDQNQGILDMLEREVAPFLA